MANYTLSATGTAANLAASEDGDPTVNSECLSLAGYASYGSGASPGDHFQLADDGGSYRGTLTILENGTEGNEFVFEKYPGDTPVVAGSDLITGWSVDSGSRYKTAAVITTEPEQVLVDGTFGDRKTSAGGCVNDFDWYWAADILYLYDSGGDPDDRSSPGVEASQRTAAIQLNSKSYVIIDGLTAAHANYAGINLSGSSNITIENCICEYNFQSGVEGSSGTTYSDIIVQDNILRYNGKQGVLFTLGGTAFSDIIVRRNDIYENGRHQVEGASQWTGGIKFFGGVGTTTTNCIIEQNKVYTNGLVVHEDGVNKGMGIWMDYIYATSDNENEIRHNLIYDNRSCAVFIEATDYTKVYGNLGWDNAQGDPVGEFTPSSIRLDSRASQTANYNLFYNNTFVGGLWGILALTYNPTAVDLSYNVFKNNVIVGQSGYALYCDEGGDNDGVYGDNNVYERNCFGAERSNFIWWTDTAHDTYADFITDSSQSNNNIETDPTFTDADNDDYSQAVGSSCIDLAENLGAPYNIALLPETQADDFPDNVVTGDQDDY